MDEGFQSSAFAQNATDKVRSHRSVDIEFGADIESGIALSADFSEFDSLKTLLDSNRDAMKLDAMKRIIRMVARGRDCSELFPAVVKNVVSKDAEIRKLVYIYLARYAEEQQDTALLSVSTFQRSLKDPNQLIRASALRVLCSTRIPMLVPIMMLAIQDASKDLSPYVRKTAAHAVLKVYSLEPTEKDQLVDIIEKLLADKTTLVVGSAVLAFEEVCPERIDLIHSHYRKLCSLLMDVDEWGQVAIINMLTRYARTQFLDPERKAFVEEQIKSADETDLLSLTPDMERKRNQSSPQSEDANVTIVNGGTLPHDYSMAEALPLLQADYNSLVESCRFLLHSRNSAVLIAAAQLIFAMRSKEDYPVVAKALVRSLHGPKEVQYALLSNIATLSIEHPGLFEPYLRSFYCFASDPLYIKLLKLDILGNLATETTSPTILREFQHYVTQPDHKFVAATIQAIGRCASAIPQIADICLNGLVRLMSRPDEKIVAECVVVLRKLLQMQRSDHKEIIMRIAQLTDTMTVPSALASILWLLGEYSHRVPKIAPDVLRKMAKTFITQEPVVKLQVLNLAAKLAIVNPKQTSLLALYVFSLARYDQNYDIRDRSRLLRALIFPQSLCETGSGDTTTADNSENKTPTLGYLAKHAHKICLAVKPAPVLQSESKDRSAFSLGSLSQLLNRRICGYQDLPAWPAVPPNPWSRAVQTTSTPAVSSCSPASSAADPTSGTRDAPHTSLRDFFSESEEEADGEDREDDDYAFEHDDDGGSDEEVVNEEQSLHQSSDWSDHEVNESLSDAEAAHEEDELVCSDLMKLEDNLASSSSDSDLAMGPLQQLIMAKQVAVPTPASIPTQFASPTATTTSTTEPSDTEECTFSSSRLQKSESGTNQSRSWLVDTGSSETETDEDEDDKTEGEEDEDFRDIELPAIVIEKTTENQKPTEPAAAPQSLPQSECPTDASIKCMAPNVDLLTLEDLDDSNGEVSGTSSATLPVLSPSRSSTVEPPRTNTISDSPSITIEPSLVPHQINDTPTPLPTFNNWFGELGTGDDVLMSDFDRISLVTPVPFPVSFDWSASSENLRWFEPHNPVGPYLRVRYQFARLVRDHNPNLVVLRMGFSTGSIGSKEEKDLILSNLHLDLTSTVMGRLLLDANRIEPFAPIAKLSSNSEEFCMLAIDFAGFTDPIELNLAYTISSSSGNEPVSFPISITPPAGELIKPNQLLDDTSYTAVKAQLISAKHVTESILTLTESKRLPEPDTLLTVVLQNANVHFCGAQLHVNPSHEPQPERKTVPLDQASCKQTLVFQFSGLTISDRPHAPCLIELHITGGTWSLTPRSSAHCMHPPMLTSILEDKLLIINVFCAAQRIRSGLCSALYATFREAIASFS